MYGQLLSLSLLFVCLQADAEPVPNGMGGGQAKPNDAPARAFWQQPTFARLIHAAQQVEATMLPEKQRQLEINYVSAEDRGDRPVLRRDAIPELDAMKASLAKGVLAPRALWRAPPAWASVRHELERRNRPSAGYHPDEVHPFLPGLDPLHRWVYRQITLAPARPSFFKTLNEIGRPRATPEELSAQFGIEWTLQVNGASEWTGSDYSSPVRNGVWDIGNVTQRLVKPIHALAVSTTGDIAIAKTDAEFSEMAGGDHGDCAPRVHIQWPENGLLPGYAGFDDAQTLFRTLRSLAFTKAKVSIKQQRLRQPEELDGPTYSRASTSYIDLDGDGADDVAVWNAVNTQIGVGDGPEGNEYNLKLIFVNVKGFWHLLDYDEDDGPCGC
jgi:hypothetical protein